MPSPPERGTFFELPTSEKPALFALASGRGEQGAKGGRVVLTGPVGARMLPLEFLGSRLEALFDEADLQLGEQGRAEFGRRIATAGQAGGQGDQPED